MLHRSCILLGCSPLPTCCPTVKLSTVCAVLRLPQPCIFTELHHAQAGTTVTAIYIMHEARAQGYADISLTRLWPKAIGASSAPQYFFTGTWLIVWPSAVHHFTIIT